MVVVVVVVVCVCVTCGCFSPFCSHVNVQLMLSVVRTQEPCEQGGGPGLSFPV